MRIACRCGPVVCGPASWGVPPGVLSLWAGCVVHIPEGFVSPAVALAGAVVAAAGLGRCVGRARLEVTGRQLPLALLDVVSEGSRRALFSTDYALGGAGLLVRTIAMVTLGVYTLRAFLEGRITALVVRGLRAVCADLVQVARG
ncbi:MAG: energy-coupling factor ABC transporter permease [Pseudonocardiales bacterium]|nr:energy-coupling factor ABC transporter permease [Pseudonocardiales bacterium]